MGLLCVASIACHVAKHARGYRDRQPSGEYSSVLQRSRGNFFVRVCELNAIETTPALDRMHERKVEWKATLWTRGNARSRTEEQGRRGRAERTKEGSGCFGRVVQGRWRCFWGTDWGRGKVPKLHPPVKGVMP